MKQLTRVLKNKQRVQTRRLKGYDMRSQPGVTGFEDGGRGHEPKSVGNLPSRC